MEQQRCSDSNGGRAAGGCAVPDILLCFVPSLTTSEVHIEIHKRVSNTGSAFLTASCSTDRSQERMLKQLGSTEDAFGMWLEMLGVMSMGGCRWARNTRQGGNLRHMIIASARRKKGEMVRLGALNLVIVWKVSSLPDNRVDIKVRPEHSSQVASRYEGQLCVKGLS